MAAEKAVLGLVIVHDQRGLMAVSRSTGPLEEEKRFTKHPVSSLSGGRQDHSHLEMSCLVLGS